MSTSTDGGATWGTRKSTANNATVIGGQPLVQPYGTVIVPIENAFETSLLAFTSTDGGVSWNSTITVTSITHHTDAGNIRSGSLPTAEIDGSGRVYVVWSDCRFERRCRANDLVMTTSTNGTSWSAVTRIPADAVGSGVDHFIPGLAVDKSTSGSSAHLGLAYYYYPATSCSKFHLSAQCGVCLLYQRGEYVEREDPAGRTHDADLAGEYHSGVHGRGLHLYLVRQRNGPSGLYGRESKRWKHFR